MRSATTGLAISFLSVLLLLACSERQNEISEQRAPDNAVGNSTAASIRHCFRNKFPIDDTADVEELVVVVEGDRATGEYNWIPAYKDKRLGRFNGSIQQNTVSASYDYRQEGQSGTTTITINIEEEQAIIEGGVPELGLNTTMARVSC